MQEAGATARTGMQIRGQQAMQAAELAAHDKRAAEAERARRDDNEFRRTLQEEGQLFQAEQNRLSREHDDAMAQKSWDRADEIAKQQNDLDLLIYELELEDADRTRNVIFKSLMFGRG